MMKNDKTLSGCMVLIRGKTFLSKQIMLHMWILGRYKHKLRPLEPLQDDAYRYSHAEFLLWNEFKNDIKLGKEEYHLDAKTLYTIGARGSKHEMITKAVDYYTDQDILIKYPIKSVSDTDNKKVWDYVKTLTNKYQYGVFPSWILYLKTKIQTGKKGDKENNCYELFARLANSMNRWDSEISLDMPSIYDLYYNKHYKF